MYEIDTMLSSIVCGFQTKWSGWDTHSSSKQEISRFHIWNYESGVLGQKFIFSTPLQPPKFNEFLNFLVMFMLLFSKAFLNNLNYAPISNIPEVMKFYNLGDQSLQTDFSTICAFLEANIWIRPACEFLSCNVINPMHDLFASYFWLDRW